MLAPSLTKVQTLIGNTPADAKSAGGGVTVQISTTIESLIPFLQNGEATKLPKELLEATANDHSGIVVQYGAIMATQKEFTLQNASLLSILLVIQKAVETMDTDPAEGSFAKMSALRANLESAIAEIVHLDIRSKPFEHTVNFKATIRSLSKEDQHEILLPSITVGDLQAFLQFPTPLTLEALRTKGYDRSILAEICQGVAKHYEADLNLLFLGSTREVVAHLSTRLPKSAMELFKLHTRELLRAKSAVWKRPCLTV
jgi:hypothetical protein